MLNLFLFKSGSGHGYEIVSMQTNGTFLLIYARISTTV